MRRSLVAASLLLAVTASAGQSLVDEKVVSALAAEISGESAKRQLEFLTRQHRMRGSRQFLLAAQHIESELKGYGFEDAHIERVPADGKVFYGTQRSRPAWNAEFAELWQLDSEGNRLARLASWDAAPITLAQDSESGEATGELVDIGAGTSASDYVGKRISGNLVLTSSQPGAVVPMAIQAHGAAGIVSYAQNQKTAWWGDDDTLVRWGHLETFAPVKAFAFMVSLKQAREFQRQLAAGQTVRLHAVVKAGKEPAFYDIPMATIAGTESDAGEIVFSCHLDHPRPGANDNASGCATILEIARSLRKLIDERRLSQPRRTIRFVWPAEIEGTMALLNGRPELAARVEAAVHLDMVGGGPVTKAIFHVTRGPASLPSYVNDVAEEIGRFVNDESSELAAKGATKFPLTAPEGGKEPLMAQMAPFSMGSDHQVYTDSSFSIPTIYLNDWPDRYIHTSLDVPANIDPTKLKRAAFIAAASGWFLATSGTDDLPRLREVIETNELRRRAAMRERKRGLDAGEAANLMRFHAWYEKGVLDSLSGAARRPALAKGSLRRNPAIKGPVSVFGYDYLADKYGAERTAKLRLLKHGGKGGEYAHEALNLVDGRRTVQQIRDDLSAIYGPVPLEIVGEYLTALESIGLVIRN